MEEMEMKDVLRQYANLKQEAEDLERRINSLSQRQLNWELKYGTATDTGSKDKQEQIERMKAMYQAQRDEISALTIKVEEFIDSIEDSRIRLILRYRYIDGLSWAAIATRTYDTADSARMAVKRYLFALFNSDDVE